MSTLDLEDFALEQDADGNYLCPVEGCEKRSETTIGISRHYGVTSEPGHDRTLVIEIVGADAWRGYLAEQFSYGRGIREIAAALPTYVGRQSVKRDKDRFDLTTEQLPEGSSITSLLARPDVRTIEKAREESKKLHARARSRGQGRGIQ